MRTQIVLLALALWACSPAEKKGNSANVSEVVSLDAKAFKESLDATPDAVILDVRTPEEVAEGAIPGAVNIDFNAPDFSQKMSVLDKSQPYYVYCKAGGRSSKATDQMKAQGFTNIHNLEGGFTSWVDNGFESTKP